MGFVFPQKVLFKHCDPAGIVFYPRYFEMLNDAIEAMFDQALDWSFAQMHPAHGIPTATVTMDFKAPSRLGDDLVLHVAIRKLGRSSMTLQTVALAGTQVRFVADQVLVCVEDGRPMPWPPSVRALAQALAEEPT